MSEMSPASTDNPVSHEAERNDIYREQQTTEE